MKKMIIGMLVVSSLAFADHHGNGNPQNKRGEKPRVESQYSNLTEEQKEEFKAMKDSYTKEIKEMSLNMKEVDIKIEKELMSDLPNRLTINKLIDDKAVYRTAKDKKMMEFKLEAKEKFGIDIRNGKNKRNKEGQRPQGRNSQKQGQQKNK